MRARIGGTVVDLHGSILGEVVAAPPADDVAGLAFAVFLGSGDTAAVEVIE